ncbi:MAG: nucleotidyltransferase family protein [Acaryochloris sp. RU_4_1]|nr:nucleotidyltransferase family protein [Acaryochloris sp. RU_4_1]NJR53750.1 nucleotidyltransferase family protein [Acaryochloris sp. CRU_2_0]
MYSQALQQLNLPVVKPGYRPQALDTSLETDVYEFALLRQRTNSDRLQMSAALTRGARQLCICGLRQTHPSLSEIAVAQAISQAFLDDDYSHEFIPTGSEMTWIQDSISLAIQLQAILADLEIPYYITGGVAAATYGEPRTTRDLDIVIALSLSQLDTMVQRLEHEGFYVPGVEEIRSGQLRTLGITHQETIARADLMLAGISDFDHAQFNRRRAIEISGRGTLYLASPEDIILSKLRWGGQSQSEKQWRDVLGILKVQGQTLDFQYLDQQAETLELTNMLVQAMTEAGLS